MIEFQLDSGSGVATYLQLVQQYTSAAVGPVDAGGPVTDGAAGGGQVGDQPEHRAEGLPDLEREGLVRPRPGQGTFVVGTLPRTDPAMQARFLASMTNWLAKPSRRSRPRRYRSHLPNRIPKQLRRGGGMTLALQTDGLGKQYGRRWRCRTALWPSRKAR